jgi:hypothetical protein
MQKPLHLLGFLLLPSLLLAGYPQAALAAGFAQQTIFLSKSSVTEGDTVLIHTVVQNDLAAKFPGNLVIKDGDIKVGSVPVTLDAGEAQAVSVSWKPSAGMHKISAELQDAGGTVVGTESETFSIKEKPKPVASVAKAATSSNTAAAVESSAGIQDKIDDLSPAAGGALAPVFKLVDGSRTAIADVLDGQIANTKPKLAPLPGVVAGTSTIQTPDQGSWFGSIFNTVYFYVLTVLRFLIGSAGVFYPVLALVFFYILWRTFKRFRRA